MKKNRKLRNRITNIVVLVVLTISLLCNLIQFLEQLTIKSYQNYLRYVEEHTVYEDYIIEEPSVIETTYNKEIVVVDKSSNLTVEKKEDNLTYLGSFLLTGYDDCPVCQEEWVGTTALGIKPTTNNTIAVDPSVIPLGSYVMINGVKYHAEDVGGMIKGKHIDIFVGSHEECYSDFCNGYADVYLINE